MGCGVRVTLNLGMNLKKVGSIYHAQFKTAEGKVKSVSTKCTDKTEAARVAKAAGVAELESAAKAGRLSREAISHIMTGGKLTTAKAITKFEESLLRRRSPKTAANVMSILNAWATETEIESLPPSAITEAHVDEWINDPESTLKAATRQINLSAIRTFFDFCQDHGWAVGNPAGRQRVNVNMRLMSHEQKEVSERVPFTDMEIKAILKQVKDNPFWTFAVIISNEIGLRLGDICQLEWQSFVKPGVAVVWTDKRDRRVEVPVSARISDLLTEIPISSAQYMFPEEREMVLDVKRRSYLSIHFKRLCTRAGVTGKSFHCLRHGCITRWASQGKSLETIAKDVGHLDTDTTKGYIHQ